MRTIAVMNQKGGTGKTTTTVTLAAALASRGTRTLVVDMDPQGHSGLALGVPQSRVETTIADILRWPNAEREMTEKAMWPLRPHLTLVTSGPSLSALESPASPFAQAPGREYRLRDWLATLAPRYDVCLVDCSPSIGLLTFNAMVAASAVLVPVETGYFALRGAERQLAMIAALTKRTGRDISQWILPTLYTPGETTAEKVLELLRTTHGSCVAPTPIRRDPAVGEAVALGMPLAEHNPLCPACMDYSVLADWVSAKLPFLEPVVSLADAYRAPASQPASGSPEALSYERTGPRIPVVHSVPTGRAAELARRAQSMPQPGSPPQVHGRSEHHFPPDTLRESAWDGPQAASG